MEYLCGFCATIQICSFINIDLKKVEREGHKEIRRQVVRPKKMDKAGETIEKLTGVRQNCTSEIWTTYQREGEPPWSGKNMGGSPGAIWFLMKKRNQIKSLSANKERCFSTKDHPPVLPVETKQQRLNMISAINSQGQVRFMIYQETMNHTNH